MSGCVFVCVCVCVCVCVACVRASGRGEAACLRERDYASVRWVIMLLYAG